MTKAKKKEGVRNRIAKVIKKQAHKTPVSKQRWHPNGLAAAIMRSVEYNARAWKAVTSKK